MYNIIPPMEEFSNLSNDIRYKIMKESTQRKTVGSQKLS